MLAYCGAPIRVWQGGRWTEQAGWAHPAKVQFARLRPRGGALCDIPDLELFPVRYTGVQSVMFRAALEVGITQQAFAFLAFMRRMGLLRAPPIGAHACAGLLTLAEFDPEFARWGMVTDVIDEGTSVESHGAPAL